MMGYDLNTTEATAGLAAQDDEACYLIRKGGAWYRPNSRGYTTSAIQAGRYTLKDAEDITHPNGPVGPRDGMFYVHVSEVRDDDLAEVLRLSAAVADLTAANSALAAECARLKGREVEARGVIAFYASESTYETQYERMSCGCCTDIFEPINDDKGQRARAYLAGGAE